MTDVVSGRFSGKIRGTEVLNLQTILEVNEYISSERAFLERKVDKRIEVQVKK